MKGNPGLSAGYAGTSGFRQVVKCTILIKKKEGMSDEDFVEYYNTKHAKMATDVIIRHDPITYSLVILPSDLNSISCELTIPVQDLPPLTRPKTYPRHPTWQSTAA